MIPSSPICNVCEYSQCGDKCPPTAEQAARGLNPLGAVPSQLWNSLWHDANAAVNCIKFASDTLMCEINSVLTEAGISPDAQYTNQLASAITCLLQVVDSTGGKSSVKSSTTPGMVSIDNNGYMTVNNVGNANNLTTTNRVIVDAVNEINSTYGNAYGTLWQNACDMNTSKADIAHASCDTDYGVGTASAYGHLKISDVCNAVLPDCGNVAASQKALADIWAYINSTTGLGNTLACPLGTGAPGICTTAARGDHVHPYPTWSCCARSIAWTYYNPPFKRCCQCHCATIDPYHDMECTYWCIWQNCASMELVEVGAVLYDRLRCSCSGGQMCVDQHTLSVPYICRYILHSSQVCMPIFVCQCSWSCSLGHLDYAICDCTRYSRAFLSPDVYY